ncbi:HPP family protein [Novosphingobium umbonatum]|nr:HPP family protein [Novosphingobium umbonatum]
MIRFRPLAHFAQIVDVQPRSPLSRQMAAGLGGALGILVTGLVMRLWLGDPASIPLLVAPMGASAVLLFAVPASPLAQPWAIVGGNVLSALCGIFWMKWLGDPAYAACLAVASAIVVMSLARCLHPPGGACALTCVIGGKAVVAAGWSFALVPVAANSILLVTLGLIYNSAIRSHYPNRPAQYVAPGPEPKGFTMADIEAVLAQYDDLIDVRTEDLDALFRKVEARSYRRLHGIIRCDQIMQSGVPALHPDQNLQQARLELQRRGLRAMPVVDEQGHVEGLLTAGHLGPTDGPLTVREVMNPSPCLAAPDTPIDELLPILSGGVYTEAVVVDAKGHLLGLITQTDLLDALWRGHVAEQIALRDKGAIIGT